jgi:hypothetical protein
MHEALVKYPNTLRVRIFYKSFMHANRKEIV